MQQNAMENMELPKDSFTDHPLLFNNLNERILPIFNLLFARQIDVRSIVLYTSSDRYWLVGYAG